MNYVYVLEAETDHRFYLGYSSDLRTGLESHNAGKNQSTKYSKWRLVYYEAYRSLEYAREREASLKRNQRMRKLLYTRIKASMEAEQFSGGGSS